MKPVFEDTIEAAYMDNAATTMMDDEVVDAMLPFLQERYGNPETPYHLGRDAADGIEAARESIAELLGANTGEIVFTSGGTESNNWALKCAGWHKEGKASNTDGRYKSVCSAIEHNSVLECVKYSDGGVVVGVDGTGRLDAQELHNVMEQGNVRIVSIQHCNNEIGTIQDIAGFAEMIHSYDALLHVDAVQSFGKWEWDVDDLGADLVSISAHKMHGPMGVGALYIKPDTKIEPLLHGGGQELERRSGTLAVPSIVGFGKAAELAWSNLKSEAPRQRDMLKKLADIAELKHGITRNGDSQNNDTDLGLAPHILSLNLPVEAGIVAAVLNRQFGACVACGSACDTKKQRSHVLDAIGMSYEKQQNVLRVSIGRFNTQHHMDMMVVGLDVGIREANERSLD